MNKSKNHNFLVKKGKSHTLIIYLPLLCTENRQHTNAAIHCCKFHWAKNFPLNKNRAKQTIFWVVLDIERLLKASTLKANDRKGKTNQIISLIQTKINVYINITLRRQSTLENSVHVTAKRLTDIKIEIFKTK